MFKMIKQLFSLLTPEQVRKFYVLQVLVTIMAFTELLGIASIAPFMALVGDISLLQGEGVLADIYKLTGMNNPLDFLFYTGIFVLITLSISTIISMFTIWQLSLYASRVGTEISDRLYSYYMQQNWLYHASGSSAHFIKQVSSEAPRVTDQIIQPLMYVNAKAVLAIFISISILIFNPLIAVSGLLVFVSVYIILYKLVHKRLHINGQNMSSISTERFRLMNEGFGGIKDVLLLNRHHDFVERFEKSGKIFAYARGTNIAISQVPRYFMELIAFGALIGLVLILIKLHEGNLGAVLPILSIYALAAFKLLPALQQIYGGIAQIKGSSAAFEAIKHDLAQSLHMEKQKNEISIIENLSFRREIALSNISFTYPQKNKPAVNGLSMIIPVHSVVGIVGSSGSGKSTLIDILLGLLTANEGELYIDDTIMSNFNKRAWQNIIGFVPQSIFLSEGDIAENIAFGIPKKDIDLKQVTKALKLANLEKFVEQLPKGLSTKVGERGVQLSGGQRQRIGIARALYHEADVLVFDEATSALDGITEKVIMEAIHNFSGDKTIIMIAHRLKTVEKCDTIYLMEEGKIIDQGTYSQLIINNPRFKEMAENA